MMSEETGNVPSKVRATCPWLLQLEMISGVPACLLVGAAAAKARSGRSRRSCANILITCWSGLESAVGE